MTSSRPYLIRAIYEWIVDNGCTPYIAVDTTSSRVCVPKQYIKNNSITLDISTVAATKLLIDNEAITFKARFGGVLNDIYVPVSSVLAIYAREDGNGMAFTPEESQSDSDESRSSKGSTAATTNKFQFKVVPGGKSKE